MSSITQVQDMLAASYRSSSNPFSMFGWYGLKWRNNSFGFTVLMIMHLDRSAQDKPH